MIVVTLAVVELKASHFGVQFPKAIEVARNLWRAHVYHTVNVFRGNIRYGNRYVYIKVYVST